MRRTAPFRGRVGCAVSSRTRPRYPGAIEVSPVNDANYTILRRPTALDGVHSTRLTEVTRSEFSQPMPCASGDGESPSPTNNHTFDRRGAAYRARGVRFRGARGVFFRRAYSVPEQCGKNPAEHYQGEDWEKEYALPDGSTAEGGGDDKIPKKKEQKRVHWEEDDRLVTVHTLPSQSSSPMKVVPESHQKEEDQHEACVSPTDSTSENQSDEAIVLTEEEETQEEEGESPLESDCEALELAEDSTVATYHEEEDWESECRPPAECSSVMQLQGQSTVPSGGQDEEQRQCAEEAPAAKQCQSKKKVTEEAWMRECAPLMDCSPYTKRKPETIVTKEHHGEQCHNQAEPTSIAEALSLLAARMQTNQDTSSSDDECFWDDDDDLSDDEPTVIIRLNPSPEEEKKQTSLQNQRQQQAPTVTSEASTQVNLSAQPTEANLYVSQCATQSFQETETAVEVYGGQEYSSSEATASSSTVEMVPVVSYLCFPVLTYQPCTVDTSSATDLPIESSQPYDVLTATQDLSLMYQPCTVETFSATDLPIESSQPYDALTATQDLSKEDRWQVGFPAGHLEARQTRFVPATTEWLGVQDLKPDCIRTPDTESEDNSSGRMAVAEVPHTEEKHLNNGFPAGHLEATQTRFVPATTEWPGVQDLKPDCIRTLDTESEDNSSGGMAVAEVPHTEEKHLNNGFLAAHVKDTQIRFIPATTEWPGVKYWEPECNRTPDTGSEDNSYSGMAVAEVPHTEEKHLNNGFLAAQVKDTQIRFIPATTEWPGVKYWEPECIRTPDTGSEDNSWCGTAVTEVPQAEEHWDNGNASASSSGDRTTSLAHQESEEDWEQEIVPGTAGYVPHVPTFFQRMRHKSQRQRRRLYREQAVNFKQQEEQRLKAIAYVGPMEVGGQRPSDGGGPSRDNSDLPLPPVPVGAGQDGPQGSLPNATAAGMHADRRTMFDVVWSSPAPAQPPATPSSSSPSSSSPSSSSPPSHPAAHLAASHHAAAADLDQATPEVGTWEVANFLQAAWTAAADTDGCVLYKSNKYN